MKVKYLDYGFVELIDSMGDDNAIADSARMSYSGNISSKGNGKTNSSNEGLIRYLMRARHTSPFEQVELKFHIRLPIFIMRQLVRHRTACLSGDTVLTFNLGSPNGNPYSKTVKEIYDEWTFGCFGNDNKEEDLSFIKEDTYYNAASIGLWFMNRRKEAASIIPSLILKADNRKMIPYYKGSDVLSFYEYIKISMNNKRDRITKMHLRSLNEDSKDVYTTHITDIWKTGVKEVFELTVPWNKTKKTQKIKASKDHLFFTENGWKKLEDLVEGDMVWFFGSNKRKEGSVFLPTNNFEDELWRKIVDPNLSDNYMISSYGRVLNTKTGKIKDNTILQGRQRVGLSYKGKTRAYMISRLVLQAFSENIDNKPFCCHKDGNSLNDHISNLYWGSAKENSLDRVKHDTVDYLKGELVPILSIKSMGLEETYDISVAGPYHNFSANWFCVHNSLNEWSGRYSEMPPEFYVPPIKRMKFQSTSNKQMSGDSIPEDVASIMQGTMEMVNEDAYRAYEDLLANGLSKELARLVLPVSNYTEIVWKINLHNFLHFTKLRNDPNHAQDEIVTLSRIMYEMVKKKVPIACKAWEDYVHNAITFSAIEQRVIMGIFNALANEKIDESALNEWINEFADEEELNITEREKRELIPKLIKIIS